jgi:hypothetical protein
MSILCPCLSLLIRSLKSKFTQKMLNVERLAARKVAKTETKLLTLPCVGFSCDHYLAPKTKLIHKIFFVPH